jgi:hypothetical protein
MKRMLLAVLLAFGAMSTSAVAVDLSKIRCEDPEMKAAIVDMLSRLEFDNGRSFASEGLSANSISSISTQSATHDKLVCKLTVSLRYQGASQPIRGRFTIRQFSNGKLRAEWSPFS